MKINEVVNITEKILEFNKQQKGKGLLSDLAGVAKVFGHKDIKILPPKLMLQRLSITIK